MLPASRRARVRKLLTALDKVPFPFQAAAVESCLEAIDGRGRLLVEAPTGSGKTLISQLTIAVLAHEQPDRLPRALIVVPSRGLLAQHYFDAAWLRSQSVGGLHLLSSDLDPGTFTTVLRGYGVFLTTPVTLHNRLRLAPSVLDSFDVAIFDEIDTYLTVGELEERKDTWPLLDRVLTSGIPILGFTGTGLSDRQRKEWQNRGFTAYMPPVPEDWMPRTRLRFEGVVDDAVISRDAAIRDELGRAFRQLDENRTVGWGEIKRRAEQGDPMALLILRLSGERLRLFESGGASGEKYRRLAEHAVRSSPCLVMTRYIDVAKEVAASLANFLPARQIDGSQPRETVGRGMQWFRSQDYSSPAALVMTRDLGGRGLDFPNACSATFISPRSNYQTVSQEVARIRSRAQSTKEVVIFHYVATEEQAKARRLAEHLDAEKYLGRRLYELEGVPDDYGLEDFEYRILTFEESL